MDSLTQIVLGAATAEAVVGRKIGNKALLLGAIAGTIPDLDVIANPFLDTVGELTFHRSITHSFIFTIVGGWFFAYTFWKVFKWEELKLIDLFWMFFLCFLTHILLDACTTWGTQLLWPFSSYGFALYNVFVVDPHYTLPFIGFLIAVMCFKRAHPWRVRLNWMGIGLSTFYLVLSLFLQMRADSIFKKNLEAQGIEVEKMITKTTPFNIILWSCSAKTSEGYYSGFYSFFDDDEEVRFDFEADHVHLIDPYLSHPDVQTLISVTKDYYTVEKSDKGVIINDLRFGKFNGWQGEEKGEYVFKYEIFQEAEEDLSIYQINYRRPVDMAYLNAFLNRVLGEK